MEEVIDVSEFIYIFAHLVIAQCFSFRHDSRVPPKLIHMWFDKAPMLFLIIAAVSFVVGLNLFSYLSVQVRR